jgi:uncharacterized protein YdbL (DUF1318 family)
MKTLFSPEEMDNIKKISADYKSIYENAAYIRIQSEKLSTELENLATQMKNIKTNEDATYEIIAAREGVSVDEVKEAAFNFMVAERDAASGIYSNMA